MKKILSGFLVLPILFSSFFSLSAFSVLEKNEIKNENVRQKRNADFKINEEDFINTMFLRSSFFENGSDTNYFVNSTLKTSKSLTYNENGYLDFLKDSYATGIVFDKPSDNFLELYKNGDNYVRQYKLDRFYNVDKKFFLKDLTNFMYTYFKKYDGIGEANKMEQNIKNLQQVKFNEDNGKLINEEEFLNLNDKGAFIILDSSDKNIGRISKTDPIGKGYSIRLKVLNNLQSINKSQFKPIFYRGDGEGEPTTPIINPNTGKITDGKE